MSTPPNPDGRRLDGPIRRAVAPATTTDAAAASPEPPTTPPLPPIAPAEPTFVYRKPKKRPWVRKIPLGLAALVLLTAGWFGYKTVAAVRNIITRPGSGAPALKGNVSLNQLKGEGDGRVNILFLGIGGAGHDGPNLTDTIMVLSVDPKTKDVAMLSIPRDLYVKIPGHGYGKINAANADGGPALTEQVVETVIGVPIHYYILADFSGFKQAVDAVGGIDVNVTTALNDPYYPCDDGTKYAGKYCPIYFKVGEQHMNGAQALEFSRSRETTSDFDRAARQQQVLVALRAKAMQLSTLTNPVKLTGLIDAIGSHIKTDLQLSDIRELASIATAIDPTKITNKVLDAGKPDSLLNVGTNLISGAGSIELPKLGNFDYADIQDFVKNIFVDHYITQENARIEVDNGSGRSGLAATVAASLTEAHYNVAPPTNAATAYAHTVIYDYANGKKPYTINYLEQRFGVKAQRVAAPSPSPTASPGASATTPEIRIILGSDYKLPGSTN